MRISDWSSDVCSSDLQRMIDANCPAATMRPIAPSGPVRCSCPTTSARVSGRSRSASGAAPVPPPLGVAGASAPNRSAATALHSLPLFLADQAKIGVGDRLVDRIPLIGGALPHRRGAVRGAKLRVAAIMFEIVGKQADRAGRYEVAGLDVLDEDRKSTRLNSSH